MKIYCLWKRAVRIIILKENWSLIEICTEAMGGEVINADESRQLKIAKLQETQRRARELEKELQAMAAYK